MFSFLSDFRTAQPVAVVQDVVAQPAARPTGIAPSTRQPWGGPPAPATATAHWDAPANPPPRAGTWTPPVPPTPRHPEPPATWWSTPAVATNQLAVWAPRLAAGSLILPLLAIPAIILAAAAWIKTLARPDVPGRGKAAGAIVAAMVLSIVGTIAIGSAWVATAPSLKAFGSGTDVKAISLVAPGPGYTESSSTVQSDGPANDPSLPYPLPGANAGSRVVWVSNQTSLTTWTSTTTRQRIVTLIVLAPSPSLGSSLYAQILASGTGVGATRYPITGTPAAAGFEMPIEGGGRLEIATAQRGSVAVEIYAGGTQPAAALRAAAARTLNAQIAAVPPYLASLDRSPGSKEHRHNIVHRVVVDEFVGVLPATGLLALLTIAGLVVGVTRRRGNA